MTEAVNGNQNGFVNGETLTDVRHLVKFLLDLKQTKPNRELDVSQSIEYVWMVKH